MNLLERWLGHSVVRRLVLPAGSRLVTVGGATLGGSGKTPLAIACARELARQGASVAFVGHAYRASPNRARIVRGVDPLGEVGDEALLAARALERVGVPVIVAPTRERALEFAGRLAKVLVIDGVAQVAPARAALALLAVDPIEPWGRTGRVLPRGDLRAPVPSLLAACDIVVAVGGGQRDTASAPPSTARAADVSRGAWLGGTLLDWARIGCSRVGLLTALARPERIVRALSRRGIRVCATVSARDHGPFSRYALGRAVETPVGLWLATAKCALHIAHTFPMPVATLDYELALDDGLCRALWRVHVPSGQPCAGVCDGLGVP